jgi:predicted HTH transcriptional regulator
MAFINGDGTVNRHEKEVAFINKIQADLSYKRFYNTEELILEVNNACVTYLKDKGLVQLTSFDESLHPTATLSDISSDKINQFINLAQAKRGFPLRPGTAVVKVLTHLHLLQHLKICNSALLAFGKTPQQFFPTAIIKCAHFHGNIVAKPIPDYKVFQGDVFEQVDQAVDFVLSKISLSVGLRNKSNQVPVQYEIPRAVVAEAIVNAVAHRDYTSKGSVQVTLFNNRLEIANPGRLTPELSIPKLKREHSSYPTNPRLAEPMYQAGYIERFGTGTGEIYRLAKEAGLKEPQFDLEEGFNVTIWRAVDLTNVQADTKTTRQADANLTRQATRQADANLTRQATRQADNKTTRQAAPQLAEAVRRVLLVINQEMTSSAIQNALQLKDRESFRDTYLIPALKAKYIAMTIPDKPKSPNQMYRLTELGLKLKNKLK